MNIHIYTEIITEINGGAHNNVLRIPNTEFRMFANQNNSF